MAYFLIENFASGLDLRRSSEVAPPGSLRRLENAFINEGGEIEKRKAFVKNDKLTSLAQGSGLDNHRHWQLGPFPVPGESDSVFFLSRGNEQLAANQFVTAAGDDGSPYYAEWTVITDSPNDVAITTDIGDYSAQCIGSPFSNFAAPQTYEQPLLCGMSYSEFADTAYVVEHGANPNGDGSSFYHSNVVFSAGLPTTGTAGVSANAGRVFQKVLKNKGYVVSGDILYASAVGTPATMSGTGSGSLNMSTQGAAIGDAQAIGDYYGDLAVFGERGVQFYSVDPDFAATQYLRRIPAFLFAPRTVTEYGDGDVVFLTRNGIRSLQARDSSNFAKVTDVGSPIDLLIRDELRKSTDTDGLAGIDRALSDYFHLATAEVHQETGHLWVCIKDTIYVLSRYPAAKVQAWSTYALPHPAVASLDNIQGVVKGKWVADICPIGESMIFRTFCGEVFIYGGPDDQTYDDTPTVIETPFIDMGRPGDNKYFKGIDLVCTGSWLIEATTVAKGGQAPQPWVTVASVTDTTRGNDGRISMNMQGTQIAFRMTCTDAIPAKIAQVGVYYDMAAQK